MGLLAPQHIGRHVWVYGSGLGRWRACRRLRHPDGDGSTPVFAVEASALNCRSLLASARLNHCDQSITVFQNAAWFEDAEVSWFESDQTGSKVDSGGPLRVNAIRLSADSISGEDRIGQIGHGRRGAARTSGNGEPAGARPSLDCPGRSQPPSPFGSKSRSVPETYGPIA